MSILLTSIIPVASGFGAEIIRERPLLRDGFVMMGVDGKLIGHDSNDVWFFELASDVNDYRTVIKAGTRLELLTSATLEKIITDRKTRATTAYRLWNSRVTRYKGKNFIFSGYFTPLSKAEKPEPSQKPRSKEKEADQIKPVQDIDEPNDILTLPREIVEKLRAKREKTAVRKQTIADSNEISVDKSRLATEKNSPDIKNYSPSTDSVYVDRTGFLVEQDDRRFAFLPDAFGRNIQKLSLHLLPCAVLEQTELEQSDELEMVRFKVAGIMTKYKGENYLLLEKAIRTYSHGNFGR
jgi:hypothetical protein